MLRRITSRLSDALRNGRVWQLALIYMTIQVAVYGLIFFPISACFSAALRKRACCGESSSQKKVNAPAATASRPVRCAA
jgi:hypothetical protein